MPAVAYRIGTHAAFVDRMLRRLASSIAPLTTRAIDDPAIAFVDAWATTADVLTFYQERIANEGFLRTATERQSVLQLARAIGYELNPGVAASALLAFTVEDAAGAPGEAPIPPGLQVLSIPGQGERPQTFETVESITARAAWNALRPRASGPQTLDPGATEVLLSGTGHVLEAGDALLLLDSAGTRWDFRFVRTVEPQPPTLTRVTWTQPLDATGVGGAGTFTVFVFRQRAALFGYNAPDFRVLPDSVKQAFGGGTDWPNFGLSGGHVDLDATYPRILANTPMVLAGASGTSLFRVEDVVQTVRADYTLSTRVTRLTLDADHTGLSAFGLRDTLAFAQAEALPLSDRPLAEPVSGATIELAQVVDGLQAGQRVLLSDSNATQAAIIDSVAADDTRTTITLSNPLVNELDRATLLINANVVRATHGETVRDEVLGSGQASVPNQRFTLRRPPLTHVSAATASGARSTLQVRVDGVAWLEASSLSGLGPRDQAFTVRIEDDGKTNVIFGDGVMGARPSTGAENVVASYRSGVGPDGNVRAGTLTLLPARPLGIRGATNPLPASGAASPENLDDGRTNAPLTVLTLGRIVSLQDFEDFSRAFAGVGKAQATRLWTGQSHVAHVSVGGAVGGPVDTAATLPNLIVAIDSVRDPAHAVLVQSYSPRAFGVAAEVLVDARFVATDVLDACGRALRDGFAFARRAFAQPVTAAELVTLLQPIPGVQAVNLTRLYFVDQPVPDGTVPAFLPAAEARWSGSEALPAELVSIDANAIVLSQMAAAS
jgi:hypothetical protein